MPFPNCTDRFTDDTGEIYHALNRGNGRMTILHKDADYEAFERVLCEGLEKFPVDLFAYQWMSNHWHMVISPREDGSNQQPGSMV